MLPVLVAIYFVANEWVQQEPHLGLVATVNASRFGTGVGGLRTLEPCVPEAERRIPIPLRDVAMHGGEAAFSLERNGFVFGSLSKTVAGFLEENADAFPNTLGNVLETTSSQRLGQLRRLMLGSILQFGNRWGVVLAAEGFIVRKVGPDGGESVDSEYAAAAQGMHIDQNVRGFPLTDYAWGPLSVSTLLVHLSPFLKLLNIWMPLKGPATIRPLVLMDVSTLSHENCVARQQGNDIILLTHDERQRFYYRSSLETGKFVAFGTTETPHSSGSLPGEECISQVRRAVLRSWHNRSCADVNCSLPANTPTEIAALYHRVLNLWEQGDQQQRETILRMTQRQSLEMRVLVVTFSPRLILYMVLLLSGFLSWQLSR